MFDNVKMYLILIIILALSYEHNIKYSTSDIYIRHATSRTYQGKFFKRLLAYKTINKIKHQFYFNT